MSDYWKNSGYSDYNFDGKVDSFDVMLAEDEAKKIGTINFCNKKTKSTSLDNEPIDAKPLEMFLFSCLFFLLCTGVLFVLGLVFLIIIFVAIGVEDAAGIVMILSVILASIISLFVTLYWVRRNKKLLIERKKIISEENNKVKSNEKHSN